MATEMTAPKFEVGDYVRYIWDNDEWTARVLAVSLVENRNAYKPLVRWDAGWRYTLRFVGDGAVMNHAPEASLRPLPNVISLPLPKCEWASLPGGTAA